MLKTGEVMKLETPVTAYAVVRKAERRMITAISAFGLNVRHHAVNAMDVLRFSFLYFGLNIRPWKRGAMWVCLVLNLTLAFALAHHGSLIAFIAVFGVWSSSDYLHRTSPRRSK
jgi:hypothetical protein